jgi:hypothetical protein
MVKKNDIIKIIDFFIINFFKIEAVYGPAMPAVHYPGLETWYKPSPNYETPVTLQIDQ